MADINPTVDGGVNSLLAVSFAAARESTSGGSNTVGDTSANFAVTVQRLASGKGSTTFQINRYFAEFDTSGISVTPTDATFRIFAHTNNTADFFVVKANFPDGSIGNTDFDSIVGWDNDADNSSNVTKYSSEVTSISVPAQNSITLNSTALADIRDNDRFKICLIESTKDLPNTAPSSNISLSLGMFMGAITATTRKPVLIVTEGTAAGYSHKVQGVAASSIGKVNGVATANIGKVISVD